jgi:hypothetical protein
MILRSIDGLPHNHHRLYSPTDLINPMENQQPISTQLSMPATTTSPGDQVATLPQMNAEQHAGLQSADKNKPATTTSQRRRKIHYTTEQLIFLRKSAGATTLTDMLRKIQDKSYGDSDELALGDESNDSYDEDAADPYTTPEKALKRAGVSTSHIRSNLWAVAECREEHKLWNHSSRALSGPYLPLYR